MYIHWSVYLNCIHIMFPNDPSQPWKKTSWNKVSSYILRGFMGWLKGEAYPIACPKMPRTRFRREATTQPTKASPTAPLVRCRASWSCRSGACEATPVGSWTMRPGYGEKRVDGWVSLSLQLFPTHVQPQFQIYFFNAQKKHQDVHGLELRTFHIFPSWCIWVYLSTSQPHQQVVGLLQISRAWLQGAPAQQFLTRVLQGDGIAIRWLGKCRMEETLSLCIYYL